ncbi:tetraacyldisaccharide 4'-kinase [Gaopeijia maritima]|uniref:tetraacyldisaccharide 4'-kinase n=1 Tax=Gaopeijia maritima TaxID=3119007 RepID=UPI0032532953
MADGLSGWVRRWWQGGGGVVGAVARWAALPLEGVFRLAVALRNRRLGARSVAPAIPVVSIGNLTVGGTGKTPVVRWVVDRLREAGVRPAVVSRGYGRDELALHRSWHPEVAVEADPDRVAAVNRAAEAGAQVAVLDDGFQHRRLGRHLDVVLLAAETAFPGALLPRGPYREGPGALARADLVIVTRKSAPREAAETVAAEVRRRHRGVPLATLAFRPGGWCDLDGAGVEPPRSPVYIATSVAWPETVRGLVAGVAGPATEVTLDPFPDHHEFTPGDVRRVVAAAREAALVVTEKDAVKLREPELRGALNGRMVHVMVLEPVWESGRDEVTGALSRLLRDAGLGSPA